jgi:hypothetical protein
LAEWKWHSFQTFFEEQQDLSSELFDNETGYKEIHLSKQNYFNEYESLENFLLT